MVNTVKSHAPSPALRTLMVLCALAVVSLLYLPLPALDALAQSHGIGAAGMVSSFGFAYAFGFLVFGPLSDRVGRRMVMVVGLLALTTITWVLAVVQTPSLIVVSRVLQGLAAATFPPVAIAYLAERGTPRQISWNVAWMSTAFLSAGLLGQIYGGFMAARWGLQCAFLPLTAIYALTAWLLWRTPADKPAVQPAHSFFGQHQAAAALLADTRLQRVYVPAFLLLMCFVAFYMALDMRLGVQLTQQGLSPLMARVLAAPAFLAPLAVATAMPRLGAQRIITIGLACATSGLALSAIAGESHVMALMASSILFVAGIGISVPGLIARVAAISEAPVRGLAVAIYTFVLFVGASLGPWLAQLATRMPLEHVCALLAVLLGSSAIYASTGKQRAIETQ